MVVVLLLLLSGDIETNPGPVGKDIQQLILVNLMNKHCMEVEMAWDGAIPCRCIIYTHHSIPFSITQGTS